MINSRNAEILLVAFSRTKPVLSASRRELRLEVRGQRSEVKKEKWKVKNIFESSLYGENQKSEVIKKQSKV